MRKRIYATIKRDSIIYTFQRISQTQNTLFIKKCPNYLCEMKVNNERQ